MRCASAHVRLRCIGNRCSPYGHCCDTERPKNAATERPTPQKQGPFRPKRVAPPSNMRTRQGAELDCPVPGRKNGRVSAAGEFVDDTLQREASWYRAEDMRHR